MKTNTEIVLVLKELCEQKDLTIQEACKKAGLSEAYLFAMLAAKKTIPFTTLRNIADTISLTKDEFVKLVNAAFNSFENFEIRVKDFPSEFKKEAQMANLKFWESFLNKQKTT